MANGTQIIYVTGEARWAQIYPHQKDKDYNNYHIQVAPDAASMIALKTSGSRLEGKEEDDKTWFKFRRDHEVEFVKGQPTVLGPPDVITLDENRKPVPFDKAIGNGSIVTVKLEVYPSKKGTGTRLKTVCVDKHVPYEPKDAGNSDYPF